MVVKELIQRGTKFYPRQTAVLYQGETLTFEQVYSNSNRLANALLKLGLRKGDRVAFLLANSLQSIEIDFALLLSGLVRVPLNTRLSEAEHLHMIRETEAKAILFTEEFSGRVVSLQPNLTTVQFYCQTNGTPKFPWILSMPDVASSVTDSEPAVKVEESDLATIQYTSGTTGKLKAAVHTQATWVAICNNILSSVDIEHGDSMLHAAPLTHASGTLVLPHWVRGASNIVLPGFNPQEYLETVDREKPTTLNLVPTMIVMLLNFPGVEQYSFASVRNIIYGASPMPREALRRGLALWGAKFVQYYGQTEAPLILTLLSKRDHLADGPESERRLLSCGRCDRNPPRLCGGFVFAQAVYASRLYGTVRVLARDLFNRVHAPDGHCDGCTDQRFQEVAWQERPHAGNQRLCQRQVQFVCQPAHSCGIQEQRPEQEIDGGQLPERRPVRPHPLCKKTDQ